MTIFTSYLRVQHRWLHTGDMTAVERIEKSLPDDVQVSRYDVDTKRHHRNMCAMVSQRGEYIIGYMLYEIDTRHKCFVLHRLCVERHFQLRGVGRQMLDYLAAKLSLQNRDHINTVVNETNVDACKFLVACGYEATGLVPNEFGERDGVAFTWAMPGAEASSGNRLAKYWSNK